MFLLKKRQANREHRLSYAPRNSTWSSVTSTRTFLCEAFRNRDSFRTLHSRWIAALRKHCRLCIPHNLFCRFWIPYVWLFRFL